MIQPGTRRLLPDAPPYYLTLPLPEGRYICDACNGASSFVIRGSLTNHLRRTHNMNLTYQCPQCQFSHIDLKTVKQHITNNPTCRTLVNRLERNRGYRSSQPGRSRPTVRPMARPTLQNDELRNLIPELAHIVDQLEEPEVPISRELVGHPRRSSTQLYAPITTSSATATVTTTATTSATNDAINISQLSLVDTATIEPEETEPELNTTVLTTNNPDLSLIDVTEEENAPPSVNRDDGPEPTWESLFNDIRSAEELEWLIEQVTESVQAAHAPHLLNPPRNVQRRPGRTQPIRTEVDLWREKSRIQRLYKKKKLAAYQEITGIQHIYCEVPKDRITSYFQQIYEENTASDVTNLQIRTEGRLDQEPTNLLFPISPTEILKQLKRKDTAAGPDGLKYSHWKKFDPTGYQLSVIFSKILEFKHIPTNWITSTTILIHKKDDVTNLDNWRPIALSNTILKLFNGCMENRLRMHANHNNALSKNQKGFTSYQGCLEHNFILQTAITTSKRNRSNLAIAWIDLKNAFGSIPHDIIEHALTSSYVDAETVDLLLKPIRNSKTRIRTNEGLTEPIRIKSGVLQGDPISPLIFNLSAEFLIQAVEEKMTGFTMHDETFKCLAYADDLVLMGENQHDLQRGLEELSIKAHHMGLKLNIPKCATLNMIKGMPSSTAFNIQASNLPILMKDDLYKHLGTPTGFFQQLLKTNPMDTLKNNVRKIHESNLAQWQKLDAVRTFIIPCLDFILTNGFVSRTSLKQLDQEIRKYAKRWLHLPKHASNELIYIPLKYGGAGLTQLVRLQEIATIAYENQLLNSPDPVVNRLAREEIQTTTSKRVRRIANLEDQATYLNGWLEGDFNNTSNDAASTTTKVRIATRSLNYNLNNKIEWTVTNNAISLSHQGNTIQANHTKKVLKQLNGLTQLAKLTAKRNQGRVTNVAYLNNQSNHYLRDGNYISFADWRFIHRARLQLLNLNGNTKENNQDKRCRRCGYAIETQPHVLNHCHHHSRTIQIRHNAVLRRLINGGTYNTTSMVYINQTIPNSGSTARPDITIIDDQDRSCNIIDVCISYENRREAFLHARRIKEEKYSELKRIMEERGYRTNVEAFVIGSLGSQDPLNNNATKALRISRKYKILMEKLITADMIRWSRFIYNEHLTGRCYYTEEDAAAAQLPSTSTALRRRRRYRRRIPTDQQPRTQ